MATLPEIEDALRNAHAAGDTAAARKLADEIVRLRSGTSQQQAQQPAPQEVNAAAKDSQTFSRKKSAALGIADTLGFGFGDEVGAAIGGVVEGLGRPEGFKGAYNRIHGQMQDMAQQASEDNPGTYLGGQLAGGIATGFAPGSAAIRGASLGQKAIKAAKVGAAQGALYGAGSAEGDLTDRVKGAVSGAGVGGMVGAAAPVIGNKIGKMFTNPAKGAPTAEAVKATTDAMYDHLRNAGIKYDANAYQRFAQDLVRDLKKSGFRPRDSSTIAADVKDILAQVGTSPDYGELESLRKAVGNLPKGASDLDMALAAKIREKMDKFLEWSPFIHNGSAANAPQLMKQAREMASRNIKSRLLEKAIEKAGDAPSGFENGLKNEFASLLRNQGRRFTEAEKAAMRKVSRRMGGQNLLRLLSQFGIDFRNLGGSSNLMATLVGGGGVMAGEPVTGAALITAGTAAKPLAAANAKRLARQAQGVMRLGKAGQAKALQRREPYQRAATGLLSNQTGAIDSLAPPELRLRHGGLLGSLAR